jgi:hypothetical protein
MNKNEHEAAFKHIMGLPPKKFCRRMQQGISHMEERSKKIANENDANRLARALDRHERLLTEKANEPGMAEWATTTSALRNANLQLRKFVEAKVQEF